MDLKVAFNIKCSYNYANHVHYVNSCVLLNLSEEKSYKPVKTDIALTLSFMKCETYCISTSGSTNHKCIFLEQLRPKPLFVLTSKVMSLDLTVLLLLT
jgi:hypothetical protein